MRYHYNKATRYMKMMNDSYKNNRNLFKNVHAKLGSAPQHRYSPPKDKAAFIFFAMLLTYHSSSEVGFQQARKVYDEHPEMFSKELSSLSVEYVCRVLRGVGFIYPNQAGRAWFTTGKNMFNLYQDPLLFVRKFKTVSSFLKKKRKLHKDSSKSVFPGLGPKLYSLLILLYEEIGFIDNVPDAFPVDVHIQRLFLSLGIVTVKKDEVSAAILAEFIRPRLARFCQKENVSALDLSHALWFLGNRVCSSCRKVDLFELVAFCPVEKVCDGGVSTASYRRGRGWDLRVPKKPKGSPQLMFKDEKMLSNIQ